MISADKLIPKSLKVGLPIEHLLKGDIITLRCFNADWVFGFLADIIVRNYEPGHKTLYLHWADYHKRFWTIDYDHLFKLAKKSGYDVRNFSMDTYFCRAFSRDNNEVEENWRKLSTFSSLNLIVLDSLDELYSEKKEDSLPLTYSIGKFAQLCIKNGCQGVIVDHSKYLNSYLAHRSSVILEVGVDRHEILFRIVKHPSLPEGAVSIPRDMQYKLARWM